ncbi:hypothetical protein WDU94_002416 [Cyamophila willieti]
MKRYLWQLLGLVLFFIVLVKGETPEELYNGLSKSTLTGLELQKCLDVSLAEQILQSDKNFRIEEFRQQFLTTPLNELFKKSDPSILDGLVKSFNGKIKLVDQIYKCLATPTPTSNEIESMSLSVYIGIITTKMISSNLTLSELVKCMNTSNPTLVDELFRGLPITNMPLKELLTPEVDEFVKQRVSVQRNPMLVYEAFNYCLDTSTFTSNDINSTLRTSTLNEFESEISRSTLTVADFMQCVKTNDPKLVNSLLKSNPLLNSPQASSLTLNEFPVIIPFINMLSTLSHNRNFEDNVLECLEIIEDGSTTGTSTTSSFVSLSTSMTKFGSTSLTTSIEVKPTVSSTVQPQDNGTESSGKALWIILAILMVMIICLVIGICYLNEKRKQIVSANVI